MVKKIKKYLKFVVCCALIMSLIAPSYAALSASDGSAFVTKAEFDSALADFNARLTTFEAGINSKIDSQVTSYLDRNGIWNGYDQVVEGGFNGTTYKNSAAFWVPQPYCANSASVVGDFRYGQLNAYGTYDWTKDTHFVPGLLSDDLTQDNPPLDEFMSTPLGFFMTVKSYYGRYVRYLKNNTTGKMETKGINIDWETAPSSGTSMRNGHSEIGYAGTLIMNKPFKLIDNVNKSGLMFVTMDCKPHNYWGWQLIYYVNNDWNTANYGLTGSVPHWVGSPPTIDLGLDFCVGQDMDEPTNWNGTKFTHDNFKSYSKASISPANLTTTIYDGASLGPGLTFMGTNANQVINAQDPTGQKGLNAIYKLTGPNFQSMNQFFVSKGDQVWLIGNFSYKFGNGGGRTQFFTSPWIIMGSDALQKQVCENEWMISASVY